MSDFVVLPDGRRINRHWVRGVSKIRQGEYGSPNGFGFSVFFDGPHHVVEVDCKTREEAEAALDLVAPITK